MSEFKVLKNAVKKKFDEMSKYDLFVTDVSKDDIWDVYINSFPEGTNPIYKERTEHDCQCCKQFLRAVGGVVSIIDGKVVSVWDVEIEGFYQEVANALSAYVKSKAIKNVFRHYENSAGTDKSIQLVEETTVTWGHFFCKLPAKFVKSNDDIASQLSDYRSNFDVLKRSLEEITLDSAETVLELIDQNSLYRGAEHEGIVTKFVSIKKAFDKIKEIDREVFLWEKSVKLKGASKIRNTVIGSLLIDLSEDKDLDSSVKSFESKVAPTNYKRPTALITKGMIAKAQTKVAELGLEDSLERRFAVEKDITINNVLFADREVKANMNVFDEMSDEVVTKSKSLEKVEEIDIKDFLDRVVPKADSIEVLVENKHSGNFMSLIAPSNPDSKNMLKWKNNFSWAYNGELTDSIKDRVKSAGGNVMGDLRCSLSWFNGDDLDIHVHEPCGNKIHYGNKNNRLTGGTLDVDMNAGGASSRTPVENITWANRKKMNEGVYKVIVHNFSKRETVDVGFDAEIEFDGNITSFSYDKAVANDKKVTVAEFKYSHKNGIEMIKTLPTSSSSKEVWNVNTETFNKVKMIMNSPNHWDNDETGNKHWFFIVDKCNSGERGRGFFNEFLNEDLREHRKVFEVLGSKLKAEQSDNQLSGLGFSSTQRNHAYFKVSGKFARTVKVNF
jgi:hypothetical protein